MRELNECKAEVFRRMEKGIKERKRKRNRVIACCIPLCLCLLVLSVVNPYLSSNSDAAPEGNMNHTPGGVPATGSHYLSVEVTLDKTGINSSVKEQDPAKVNDLYLMLSETLSGLTAQAESTGTRGDLQEGNDLKDSFTESTQEALYYTFVFSGSDGEGEVFRLNGNVLSNDASDKHITLSDGDRQTLMTAIRSVVELEEDPE